MARDMKVLMKGKGMPSGGGNRYASKAEESKKAKTAESHHGLSPDKPGSSKKSPPPLAKKTPSLKIPAAPSGPPMAPPMAPPIPDMGGGGMPPQGPPPPDPSMPPPEQDQSQFG